MKHFVCFDTQLVKPTDDGFENTGLSIHGYNATYPVNGSNQTLVGGVQDCDCIGIIDMEAVAF